MIRYPDNIADFVPGDHSVDDKVFTIPPTKGPSTYLHAGAGTGWPYDHKTEDAFELPNTTYRDTYYDWQADTLEDAKSEKAAQKAFLDSPVFTPEVLASRMPLVSIEYEYRAEWGPAGEALLVRDKVKTKRKTIASFDTYADAQRAAEALNNHEGY